MHEYPHAKTHPERGSGDCMPPQSLGQAFVLVALNSLDTQA